VRRSSGVVGERLEIGNEQRLIVPVLLGKASAQRAGVVAEVQRAGRPVAGEDGVNDGHENLL
jgi:hypothetical protein